MSNPEATEAEAPQQDTELDPESSTDETTTGEAAAGAGEEPSVTTAADVDEESSYDPEAATEEGVNADYQERLREFDDVDSVPVTSLPTQTSELDEGDLKVQPPGGQSG